MVTTSRLYKIIVLIAFLCGNPALAADMPLHFIGRYDFGWGGIPLGKLALSIDDAGGTYRLRLQVASAGIVNLFTRHESDTTVTGTHDKAGYHPRVYESRYWTKKKPRHIKLAFNAKGVITEEIVEPPEDPTERPVAPHTLKDGAYDPLSGMMALRTGKAVVRAFDAKRLYEVKSLPQDKVTLRLPPGNYPASPYVLSRTPLAGLTAREIKEYSKGEPPLFFYFSHDARRIPLMVRLPIMLGRVTGILVQECRTWEECQVE